MFRTSGERPAAQRFRLKKFPLETLDLEDSGALDLLVKKFFWKTCFSVWGFCLSPHRRAPFGRPSEVVLSEVPGRLLHRDEWTVLRTPVVVTGVFGDPPQTLVTTSSLPRPTSLDSGRGGREVGDRHVIQQMTRRSPRAPFPGLPSTLPP